MEILPVGTLLGRLHLLEVWDYYDIPRLFVARSASNANYVVFWTDESPNADVWLYAAVSDLRLEAIRCGRVSLRRVYREPEDGCVFVVSIPREGQAAVQPHRPDEIAIDRLPLEDDFVQIRLEPEPAINQQPSTHVAFIRSLVAGQSVAFEAVTHVLGLWREVFSNVMESFNVVGDLTPIDAGVGSFRVTLRVDDPEITGRVVDKIRRALAVTSVEATVEQITEFELEISDLAKLLEALEQHAVRLEIELAATARSLILSPDQRGAAERATRTVRQRRRLDTGSVPQADNIERVFRLLELKRANTEVTPYTLEVVPRQVAYYKQACRLLGYLNNDNELTTAGSQLLGLNHEDRLRTTSVQFEQSECGFAWIRWSGVTNLTEIDASTAAQFLREASLLGETTAPRRAGTLRSWHGALVPFHYKRLGI
jgi:hypothetical protein